MALAWTDSIVPDVTRIKRKHIQEIRDYLDAHINLSAGHPLASAGAPGLMSAAHYSLVENFSAEWVTAGNGVMTISTTLPIRATGGANPTISIDMATAIIPGAMSAADKAKLDGIAANANNYSHPATHAATIIDQDASHRFVTDVEKASWNAKSEVLTSATHSTAGLMSANDKTKLDAMDGFPIGTVVMFSSVAECDTKNTGYYFNLSSEPTQYPGLKYGDPWPVETNPFIKWRILTEMNVPSGNDTTAYRMPLAAGPGMPEKTKGGVTSVKLTKDEIPKHRHLIGRFSTYSNNDFQILSVGKEKDNPDLVDGVMERWASLPGDGTGGHGDWQAKIEDTDHRFVSLSSDRMYKTVEPQAHTNMPPFFALYFIVKVKE